MGILQETLSCPISDELEQEILEVIKRKLFSGVSMYVDTLRAAEALYGPGACDAIRAYRAQRSGERNSARAATAEDNSLKAFCTALERACVGSHEWEKLEDSSTRQAYRFTRCLYAEVFRALGAEDIGLWICQGDGPAAAAFNPRIRFERTKTLMEGADCCDHVYYIVVSPST